MRRCRPSEGRGPDGSIRVVGLERAHAALHLGDADAEMQDRLRVVQQATLYTVEVARRPQRGWRTEFRCVCLQEHQLLVLILHQTTVRVEEEAGVVHGLLAALVLRNVQLDAKHLAQVDLPGVVRLRGRPGPRGIRNSHRRAPRMRH